MAAKYFKSEYLEVYHGTQKRRGFTTNQIHVKRGDASATKKIYKSIDHQQKSIVTNYDNKSKSSFLSDIA